VEPSNTGGRTERNQNLFARKIHVQGRVTTELNHGIPGTRAGIQSENYTRNLTFHTHYFCLVHTPKILPGLTNGRRLGSVATPGCVPKSMSLALPPDLTQCDNIKKAHIAAFRCNSQYTSYLTTWVELFFRN
jgi:hypothetical protein